MKILGISAYYHDSAAAWVENGRVLAAVQEERFTRIKHDASFPQHAIEYCLGIGGGAPDAIVYYEKPLQKFERILSTAASVAPRGFGAFAAAIPSWLKEKLWIPLQIENALRRLGVDAVGKIHFSSHHLSHAASAFFPSPFQRAAILTLDGVGEWTTTAYGVGRDNQIELRRELQFPDSLGLLYSAFTYFCGFRVNSGEYKLMGLAPYGSPKYCEVILRELIDLRDDGSFALNQSYFGYLRGERMTNDRFAALFGGRERRPEERITTRECNLASSIQAVTDEIVLRLARTVHAETGEKNLCLAGGVALNCVANGRLLRESLFENIWVQPASGDAGGALGAALAFYYLGQNRPRAADGNRDQMSGAMLGPEYSDEVIDAALRRRGIVAERLDRPAWLARVAEAIASEKVVGLFQGRAEFGPRALGNRSILADARSVDMQRVLNLKIKFRESFRPFAPVVLAEHAAEYFNLQHASPYMLFTAPVRESRRRPVAANGEILERLNEIRSDVPAITHVDFSARVQTVDRETHPALHALLTEFHRLTGCPVMINTSFNVRGEPPVCHPDDAIAGFLETGMDALAIGSFFIEKSALDPQLLTQVVPRQFAAD
ncbi:MAG TPA: carbamoyltransferase N-terminal domain-containing protein [Opitutaceae bacterium]|nr:carbamoyltransferase N-terminal domain-containing protein [Opitutaceae bacterium]